ncbi:MAG: hypothetical protein WC023_06475 [Rhodocyclaceae bacterium]
MTDLVPIRRKSILAHCMAFAQAGDPVYAQYAAGWYEANEPEIMVGLDLRVRREIEAMRVAKSVAARSIRKGGR